MRSFTTFKGCFINGYVPLYNLIPDFFAVTGTELFMISCISSVGSSTNLLFHLFFCRGNLSPSEKFYTKRHSNGGIMAGYQDPVKQSDS